jgi:hypothetical protein
MNVRGAHIEVVATHADGLDATTNACAGLEHARAHPVLLQLTCRRQASGASTYHQYTGAAPSFSDSLALVSQTAVWARLALVFRFPSTELASSVHPPFARCAQAQPVILTVALQ